MTSNLGSKQLDQAMTGWFAKNVSDPGEVRKIVEPEMKKHFQYKNDLLNRFQTLYFTPLMNKKVILEIVRKTLKKQAELFLEKCGISLSWTEEYVRAFTNPDNMRDSGARWIERTIQVRLTNTIIRENYPSGTKIKVHWDGGRDVFTIVEG